MTTLNRRPTPQPTAQAPRESPGGWVVSPAFDLLFLANLAWPLLFLPGLAWRSETAVDFWQVYFLTLPHRWITLILVPLDPDRRAGRGGLLGMIAAALLVLVVGVRMGTGALTCLATIDYVWNAWHFAAQHAGVLRIYTRKVGGGVPWLERHGLRFFVTYSVLRTAVWLTGGLEATGAGAAIVRGLDLAAMAVPLALLVTTIVGFRPDRVGKSAYLLSVVGLYSGLLLSVSNRWTPGVVVFTTASSLFHAVEYLAVVTQYAWRRREVGSAGAFRRLAGVWLPFLGLYAAVLGASGVWFEGASGPLTEFWQGLNLWAALVHYSFDGLIWKLRRPETARALGALAGPTTAGAA